MTRQHLATLALFLSTTLAPGCLFVDNEFDFAQCGAVPVCNDDEFEVDSCDANDPTCTASTVCGTTIYCAEVVNVCLAEATCNPDEIQVTECPDDATCVERTICASSVLCQQPMVQCGAVPVCAPGKQEVDACGKNDPFCTPIIACGTTIHCLQPPTCDAVAACGPDQMQVDDCLEGDPMCTEVNVCGETVYCEEVEVCAAVEPACPEEDQIVSRCPDNREDCYEHEICDGVLTCMPAPKPEACRATPTCDMDQRLVDDCGDTYCEARTVCGTTILCADT